MEKTGTEKLDTFVLNDHLMDKYTVSGYSFRKAPRHLIIAALCLAAISCQITVLAADGKPAATGIRKTIAEVSSGQTLGNSVTGILVMTTDGDTIASLNPGKALVPASNMKTITTGAALHMLGGDYRFRTGIGYFGRILDGVLHGDLYIIGGGDPTLASDDSIAEPVDKIFGQWQDMISAAGIKEIDGYIIGDDRIFDSSMEEDTWLWNDIGTYYGSGTSGLSFFENKKDFTIYPAKTPGEALRVDPGYPETPWMTYSFPCTAGEKGTGNRLYYYTSPFSAYGEMRGTYATDRGIRTEEGSNKFPAYTCAWYFCRYLGNHGIRCTEGPAASGGLFGCGEERLTDQEDLAEIGYTLSPELSRIAFETNHESNNFFAETIFKTLGRIYAGKGSYEGGRKAIGKILSRMGIPASGIKIQDGSGLSRQNYISPAFFCRFLKAMLDSKASGDFIMSLPSPGSDGTLSYILSGTPLRDRLRMKLKSGSMDGTLCYCGYVFPAKEGEDVLIFSIMTNNSTSSSYKVRKEIEKILRALLSCEQTPA